MTYPSEGQYCGGIAGAVVAYATVLATVAGIAAAALLWKGAR